MRGSDFVRQSKIFAARSVNQESFRNILQKFLVLRNLQSSVSISVVRKARAKWNAHIQLWTADVMLQLSEREAFWLGMGFSYSLDSITGGAPSVGALIKIKNMWLFYYFLNAR